MENFEGKVTQQNPQIKTQTSFHAIEFCMRAFVIAATFASTCLTLTNKETAIVFGIPFEAKYSYSSAFRFFAYANAVVCACTLLTLLYASFAGRKSMSPDNYFLLFLGDLCLMILAMAACSAAMAEGYLGKYGNSHAGWLPICDYVSKFCSRGMTSAVLSFVAFLVLFILTVMSANKSRFY